MKAFTIYFRFFQLFVFQWWLIAGVAAQGNYPVEYLGIEKGLSNNSVTCIYQDNYGFMWFGTFDGLNRYNGYDFKVFRNSPNDTSSLINNRIVCVAEDKDNKIWVGTKKGLSIYNPLNGKFSEAYFYPVNHSKLEKIDFITNDIKTDGNGDVFVATAGQGLILFKKGNVNGQQLPLDSFSSLPIDYHAQAVQVDDQQRVWTFVQSVGLCVYDRRINLLKIVDQQISTSQCLAVDKKGNLWIGNKYGLYRYNISSKKIKYYRQTSGGLSNNNVVSLCLDKEQNLWIATDGGGVDILYPEKEQMIQLLAGQEKNSLTSAAVYDVFEDKDRRKWIGTLRGGINIIDQQRNRFKVISHDPQNNNSLPLNFISFFCEMENGDVLIGTDGGGISYWNRRLNNYKNFKHLSNDRNSLPNNYVTTILKDDKNTVWIGTYGGGVSKFNIKTGVFKEFSCFNDAYGYEDRNVWTLYQDKNKNIWAGTCDGVLYRFSQKSNRFEVFDTALTNIICLAEDRMGNLWGGTFTDLIKIDTINREHQIIKINYPVRAIHQDKSNRLWIGTEGGGLLRYVNEAKRFNRYTEKEGLSNNSVLSILEDSTGKLWISTFNGLTAFEPGTGKFKNFYESDGLQSNQFNYNAALVLKSGEFLFGGIKGFNIFKPQNIKQYSKMPRTLITGLRIDNLPIEQYKSLPEPAGAYNIREITLPYEKATFSVDFVALEYTAPDKIAYAYFLQGWDNSWQVGKLRTANYSRLTEGHYTLKIRSTNADGVWNVRERVLHITVLPPWYRTWWAYLLYFGVGFSLVYLYLIYKAKQAKLKYEVEITHIEAEKEKELHEKKLSFFIHISHEFRSPLTLIINPIKELMYEEGKLIDTQELDVVYRNARRLLSLVDQLLLFRKAENEENELKIVQVNFSGLCKEVYSCFVHQAKSKNIRYKFECENDDITIYADREKIEIVLFNLISNALKFARQDGEVKVSIIENNNDVEILVEDDGCGIPEDVGEKLFEKFYQVKKSIPFKSGFGIGLYLVKTFIDSHKGKIEYKSKLGTGTAFKVNLIKGKSHLNGNLIFEDLEEQSLFLEEFIAETELERIESIHYGERRNVESLISDSQSMLIIDDNQQIRAYIKKLFNEQFTMYEADNGTQGLRLINLYFPDIVICDVLMPGMSGIELCQKVKADIATRHIPVILLTASSSADVKLRGVEGGADDYISKPFEKDLLLARVAGILNIRNNLQEYFYNEITLQSTNLQISKENKEFLEQCMEIVEQKILDDNFNISTLCEEMGIGHSNLYKRIKTISGLSVNGFIGFIRLRKAAELLINTKCNVNEAAYQVGLRDMKNFRDQFYKLFGMNPSVYMRKYRKNFEKKYTINRKI